MEHSEPIIFVHVPKAAGSTLADIMRRKCLSEWGDQSYYVIGDPQGIESFKKLPAKDRKNIRLLTGHFYYGLHRYLPGEQPKYITMLREPIDRILSLYYYASQSPDHYLHRAIATEGLTLETIMRSGAYPEFYDLQTVFISGIRDRGPGAEFLEAAKASLRNRFAVFGLTERFSESLVLLKRTLGWRIRDIVYHEKLNVTSSRPRKSQISQETLDVIWERNQLDVELYEYAQALFNDAISQHGIGFKRDRLALQVLLRWQRLRDHAQKLRAVMFNRR